MTGQLVINRVLVKVPAHKNFFPNLGEETRKSLADDASKTLPQILDALELMLEHGKFLHNADLVSIADLSLCCELTQLQVTKSDSFLVTCLCTNFGIRRDLHI